VQLGELIGQRWWVKVHVGRRRSVYTVLGGILPDKTRADLEDLIGGVSSAIQKVGAIWGHDKCRGAINDKNTQNHSNLKSVIMLVPSAPTPKHGTRI